MSRTRFTAAPLLAVLLSWTGGGVPTAVGPANAAEPMAELDAWDAVKLMGLGVNIGNTLENTAKWETGWGNPAGGEWS